MSSSRKSFDSRSHSVTASKQSSLLSGGLSTGKEEYLLKQKQQDQKISRIKAVRDYEKECAKKIVQEYKENTAIKENITENIAAYEYYMMKKQELERLKREKELALEMKMKSQKDAIERAEEAKNQQKAKEIALEQAKKESERRWVEAMKKQKDDQARKEQKEKEALNRKKEIVKSVSASERAKAEKYRQSEASSKQDLYQDELYNNSVNSIRKIQEKPKTIADYMNTRYHNTLIVNKETEIPSAYENAIMEQQRITERNKQNMSKYVAQTWKAKDRGEMAIEKMKDEKELEAMEKELKKIKDADALHQIEQARKQPVNMQMPYTLVENRKRTQQELEKIFEEEFLSGESIQFDENKGEPIITKTNRPCCLNKMNQFEPVSSEIQMKIKENNEENSQQKVNINIPSTVRSNEISQELPPEPISEPKSDQPIEISSQKMQNEPEQEYFYVPPQADSRPLSIPLSEQKPELPIYSESIKERSEKSEDSENIKKTDILPENYLKPSIQQNMSSALNNEPISSEKKISEKNYTPSESLNENSESASNTKSQVQSIIKSQQISEQTPISLPPSTIPAKEFKPTSILKKREISSEKPNSQVASTLLREFLTEEPKQNIQSSPQKNEPENSKTSISEQSPESQISSSIVSSNISPSPAKCDPRVTAKFEERKLTPGQSELNYSPTERKSIENVQKGMKIEIENSPKNKTIGEEYKTRKQLLIERLEKGHPSNKEAMNKANTYVPRTKEELLAIRKQMMQPKSKKVAPEPINESQSNENIDENSETIKAPKALVERLAAGKKQEISKEEMLKLTTKNYELLPEVKKRREEEQKKKELRERIKNAKELEKVFLILY